MHLPERRAIEARRRAASGTVPANVRRTYGVEEHPARHANAQCAGLFRHHDWPRDEVEHRIVGHDAQAIWTPENCRAAGINDSLGKALWGQTGRKTDPTGRRSDRRPIIDIPSVRLAVYELIEAKERDNAVR